MDQERPYLQIFSPNGRDNITPDKSFPWRGRKWFLSTYMTDSEVIQTAFLAVRIAVEHEAREKFLVDGVSVFDPHYDLNKLITLRKQPDALSVREEAPQEFYEFF